MVDGLIDQRGAVDVAAWHVDEPTVSIDDIEHLIDTGTAEGIVEPLEQKLALGASAAGRTYGPRHHAARGSISTQWTSIRRRKKCSARSRWPGFRALPVYEGDLDHVIGFVHIKDLFRQQYLGWTIELRKLLHPALVRAGER